MKASVSIQVGEGIKARDEQGLRRVRPEAAEESLPGRAASDRQPGRWGVLCRGRRPRCADGREPEVWWRVGRRPGRLVAEAPQRDEGGGGGGSEGERMLERVEKFAILASSKLDFISLPSNN